jgi:hypothetical protein
MRIAIDINDVLRDIFYKSEQIYRKYYLSEVEVNVTSEYNESKDEWIQEEEENFKYDLSLPVTSLDLINHFKFPTDRDLFEFFYVDFAMEIFGNSPPTKNDTFKCLNSLYKEFRDNHEILIISDEIEKSKPATLFFLAKNGSLIEKIKFFSTITRDTLWEECDVIVTANPDLIENSPEDFTIVKYNTSYNREVQCVNTISDISELSEEIKKIIR